MQSPEALWTNLQARKPRRYGAPLSLNSQFGPLNIVRQAISSAGGASNDVTDRPSSTSASQAASKRIFDKIARLRDFSPYMRPSARPITEANWESLSGPSIQWVLTSSRTGVSLFNLANNSGLVGRPSYSRRFVTRLAIVSSAFPWVVPSSPACSNEITAKAVSDPASRLAFH